MIEFDKKVIFFISHIKEPKLFVANKKIYNIAVIMKGSNLIV